jgi:hypothetical protein
MSTKRRGHNEGSIRQRTDRSWEARISLPNGKGPSLYDKTRREVQDRTSSARPSATSTPAMTSTPSGRRWLSSSTAG